MTAKDNTNTQTLPDRPERYEADPLPSIPNVQGLPEDKASTTYSHYRTGLSHHRTELSEHRTDLSEFRTDLSQHRTGLSQHRTDLSQFRTDLSTSRTEMSRERTELSIQRTRMSADRTLMSYVRTALSLISFGFTIHAAFQKLVEANVMQQSTAPRNFGLALLGIGVVLLFGGIGRHVQFALYLRQMQADAVKKGLAEGGGPFPVSVTLLSAIALMLVGIVAILNIVM